ncbi:deoxyribodipyrimidine photo-lyase [Spirulina subsalsa FACHB-351]|uniref:Deoxyribodipyrimidine photo-lyase n=1 Tax=Spirulina subsalsa FACHB-351 TaxID=234711 RepID=A0ABT3L4S1_9CYAN|nr:FAD-binding domain-containing protein [Spirulina subsalsa]MCW6036494.1 deoxyribodipyrimidine photo-lyase [Spirulina subsalsa FACHB-351]
MSKTILFWHRRDLRLTDHLGLNRAQQYSQTHRCKMISLFCFDPNILQRDDIAPARVAYLIGCLADLQQQYQKQGSDLYFFSVKPQELLPKLAQTLNSEAVFWTEDVEPYARKRDEEIKTQLEQLGINVFTVWDQLLHPPGDIQTKTGEPYKVYTPFWKNWLKQPKLDPVGLIQPLTPLTDSEQQIIQKLGAISLPTAQALGYSWENGFLLNPGRNAAEERLAQFCDQALVFYDEQRNFPALDGTSLLSPALKFGVLGIRQIWQQAAELYSTVRSDEARNNIQTWQQELAWREFYQHALYFFPELAEGPYREAFQDFPWDNNEDHFQAWCEGKTGYPIVDAAMRQLNETGWMHNRCRMIVASFLTKDLIIDWRWGEKYFMQTLVDGDLAANNGGWQWSASSGMDPKPLRIFNPASQAQKFDPEGEYIRQWVRELSSVDSEYLVTGKIPKSEREACGYPAPIVDHKRQQAEFKARYKLIRLS